jgi:phosphatidylserine/phosphatidylglycerophosphate/cardiolipin synthase-like enzyme
MSLTGGRGASTADLSGSTPATTSQPAEPTTVTIGAPAATASGAYRLITEPDDGMSGIYNPMSSATVSLDLSMYELVDAQAESTLAADAERGVSVRVVLDGNEERKSNTAAYQELSAHGVSVHWSPPRFPASHEKAMVIDGQTALIMTGNLTSRYYPNTRDFAVVDSVPADVAAVEQVFDADFDGVAVEAPAGGSLVWSPGSQAALVAFIESAQSTIAVENEELSDQAIVQALVRDEQRGVAVSLTMTYQKEWAPAFNALTAAGASVATYTGEKPIYIHAKVIDVDAGTDHVAVLMGSQNFTQASLDRNRELGVVIDDAGIADQVAATLAADHTGATPWQP